MPLSVTLDPLDCKNLIRHSNGRNDKILNILHYNKTFTLLEDHYFQERLEHFQTPFTVHKLNKMYTGTFTFMPADKDRIYDLNQKPLSQLPELLKSEVVVSLRCFITDIRSLRI